MSLLAEFKHNTILQQQQKHQPQKPTAATLVTRNCNLDEDHDEIASESFRFNKPT